MGKQGRELVDHVAAEHKRTRRSSRIVTLTLFVVGILVTFAIAIFAGSGDTEGGKDPITTTVPAPTTIVPPEDGLDPEAGESVIGLRTP